MRHIVLLQVRTDNREAASGAAHPLVIQHEPEPVLVLIQPDHVIGARALAHVPRIREVFERLIPQELQIVCQVRVIHADQQPKVNRQVLVIAEVPLDDTLTLCILKRPRLPPTQEGFLEGLNRRHLI